MDNEKIGQLNNLIKSANNISSGEDFIKMLQSRALEKVYIDADINATQAPEKLKEAEKNYYVFTEGDSYYRDIMRDRYELTAQKEMRELLDEHKLKITRLNNLLKGYEDQKIYDTRIQDLSNKYTNEIKVYDDKKDFYIKRINTSDRKTYYENQQTDTLKKWHKLIFVLYWILFCVLAFILLLMKRLFRDYKTWILLGILIAFPFIVLPLLKAVRKIMSFFMGFFPTNVYKTLDRN